MISKLESCYIYDIVEEFYFVNIDGTFGYIPTSDIEILTGKFVIVDKSDQEAKIYQDNVLLYATPVNTGTPTEERESDEGIFEIYDISHNRDLVGPGYRSYVDVMLKYNGGEGLHDAEYHINEDGKKHGWKSIEDFGGDTYLTAGSHGCINMPNEAAIFAYNTLELNDKVLVKK